MSAKANGRWKDVGSCHWWRPRAQIISLFICIYIYTYIQVYLYTIYTLLFTGPKCRSNSPGAKLVTGFSERSDCMNSSTCQVDTSKFENSQSESSNMVETCLIIWQYYWRLFGSPEKYRENIVIFQSQQNKRKRPGLLPNLSSLFEPQRLSLKTSTFQAIVAALRMALLLVRRSHLSMRLEPSLWWKNSRCILTFNFQWVPILSPIFSYTLTL